MKLNRNVCACRKEKKRNKLKSELIDCTHGIDFSIWGERVGGWLTGR